MTAVEQFLKINNLHAIYVRYKPNRAFYNQKYLRLYFNTLAQQDNHINISYSKLDPCNKIRAINVSNNFKTFSLFMGKVPV